MTELTLFNNTITDSLLSDHLHDPFTVLGCHPATQGNKNKSVIFRALIPHARQVTAVIGDHRLPLQRQGSSDLFCAESCVDPTGPYRLQWQDQCSNQFCEYDPYSFAPLLQHYDLHLFAEGRHHHLYRILGSHCRNHQGVDGVSFAVWAPNARRVSVVGCFNQWDGRRHLMRVRGQSGVWELFIPGLSHGELYKFEITGSDNKTQLKTDPYAQHYEMRPNTAAIVTEPGQYTWGDSAWLQQRAESHWLKRPLSVYEVHLGSWRRNQHDQFLNYRELAQQLVSYVQDMGFTHIELLPITEHPLDDSWGYQATGYFAPTSRFGSPDQLRELIDLCHRNGIGVILDWVPAHFPKDAFSLAKFDGSDLYEHSDPRRAEHKDWGTLIYNYDRNEVRNFLLASANYWLEEFHIDGLRVDAVASMLYLDYSREDGEWVVNEHGGNENLEAVRFIKELNTITHRNHPGTITIAEESTSWPQVSRPVDVGGLGFSMKWNMGWMHDILTYMKKDPVHRRFHQDKLTFGLLYAFTENFVLPFSHDEVVHGKGSMINKMPGDRWQQFANLRLLYTFMYTYPGAKHLFMGSEFAQFKEWDCHTALDWQLLDCPADNPGESPADNRHRGMQQLVRDLNHLYKSMPALFERGFEGAGFEWIDCDNKAQSLLVFRRLCDSGECTVVLNFTPVVYDSFTVGVAEPGTYQCVFNSDSRYYGGSDYGHGFAVKASAIHCMGNPYSIEVSVPPLAGLILTRQT